jgi:hypothetical protein
MSAPLPSRSLRRIASLSQAVSTALREMSGRAQEALGGPRGVGLRGNGHRSEGVERLEERRLFTTLVGGDVFEYSSQDPANPANFITNRIVLQGNIVAELVGGSIDPTSANPANPTILVSDVPGRFFQSQIGRQGTDFLGGVGGGSGVRVFAAPGTSVTNSPTFPAANPQGFVPYTGGSAAFNLRAMAVVPDASATGATTYGFNVVRFGGALGTAGETSIVQVLRFDADGQNARVVAELNAALAAAPNSSFVNSNGIDSITAAAYDPTTNRIFFVAYGNNQGNVAATPAPTLVPTQKLFSFAVTNSAGAELTAAQMSASVQAFNGTFNRTTGFDTKVNALTVDRVSGGVRLVGYYVDALGGAIFDVDTANTNNVITGFVRTRVGARLFNSVTGLAIINDTADRTDTLIYAVESGSAGTVLGTTVPTQASATLGAQVLLINRLTGEAQQLGSLPGRTGGATTAGAGNDVQSLAFDPQRRNPFTGERGTLVSMDVGTDQFVAIDARNRLPGVSALSLFVSRADAGSSIVVGTVAAFNAQQPEAPRPMQPFTGSAGTLRVTSSNPNAGGLINLTSPAGVGGVFLGLKTFGNQDADLNNIPLLAGQLAGSLGVRGAGSVTAGVVTSPSLLRSLTNQGTLADRLLGQNVTDVSGIIVLPVGTTNFAAGSILAIDSDGIDINGVETPADQLTLIDRSTGRSISQTNVFRTVSGNQVAMANGRGVTVDEQERVLAVFLQRFADDQTSGGAGTLPGRYPDFAADGQAVIALTISGPGPTGFILAESSSQRFLYSFSNVGGQLSFTPLGPVVDADGNTIAAARSLGVSGTQVLTVGFPVGNPVPSQSTGGQTVNLAALNPRSLAYANDGQIYLLTSTGQGLEVRQVTRDTASGAVTGLGAASTIAIGGTSPVQGLNDLTPDPTTVAGSTLLGVGSSSLSLLPTRSLGSLTQAPDGASGFQYRGVTRLAADDIYAVTFNGSTLNLRRAQLVGTPLQTSPNSFNIIPATPRPGQLPGNDIRTDGAPSSGRGPTTAVLGISATARRPGDDTGLYGVGFSASTLIPTVPVLGDLGARDVQQISMNRFNVATSVPDTLYTLPVLGGQQYQFTRYLRAFRDTATSGLLNASGNSYTVQVVGQGSGVSPGLRINNLAGTPAVEVFTQTFGTVSNGIVDTRAMTTNREGSGVYLTSGFNYDSPVPAAPIPGNFGSFFGVDPFSAEANLRSLAFGDAVPNGQLQDGLAVLFNGTGTDLYRMVRSTTTGGISSFTKVNTESVGIRDPRNDLPILFVYTIFKDPNTAGRFFIIGSSDPTADDAPMTLYAVDLAVVDGVASVTINNTDQPPRDLVRAGGQPFAGQVFKAGAINAAGEMFVVFNTNGRAPNLSNGSPPSSQMFRVDRTTGVATGFGALTVAAYASAVPTAGGAWSGNDSNIRGMQFRVDTDGREKLVLLDQGFTGGAKIGELDFGNIKSFPQALPGGVPANIPGVTGTIGAAVALQSSIPGLVGTNLTSFAIDQYGRGYSIQPGTSFANPDRLLISPNELYAQEAFDQDNDGDAWLNESVRIGWLVNDDGTAFTDSMTTFTGTLDDDRLISVVRNDLAASQRSGDPLFGLDRLASLVIPGSVLAPTVAPNGNAPQTLITVTPVRRANTPTDTGLITINGSGATPGSASNITGLAFDLDGSLRALDKLAVGGGRLVALPVDEPTSLTGPLTGNPTFNTLAIVDEVATPFIGTGAGNADPRGLAADIFGRFYTADGTTIASGRTRLLVSENAVSVYRIDVATGIATRQFDLADNAQLQQQPILSRFGGIAFQDANTVFLVQKDLRTGTPTFDQLGRVRGVDRLVTATFPATLGGVVAYARYNNANTAGAIQVGNIVPPPGTASGTPTDITAIDFSQSGQLIGLDNGFGGSNRLVRIELDLTNSLAPTNSQYVSDPGSATLLEGLSAFGTQLASVGTAAAGAVANDRLLFSNNDLSLFAIDPATGTATIRGALTINGATVTDDQPVSALATQPGANGSPTGLLFAILRGREPGTSTPADFLYTISAASGVATLIGQVRITTDQNGNAIAGGRNSRIVQLEFSGDRDAQGNYILLGVNDPEGSTSDRQLVRIGVDAATVSTSSFVRGSDAGDIPDTQLGFASDVVDGNQITLPQAARGRFYALDTVIASASSLTVTPSQLYQQIGQLTLPTGTNAAFGAIGNLLATPTLLSPQGGALLDLVTGIDFAPGSGQLFGIRESFAGVSTLISFPTTLPGPAAPGTRPSQIPSLSLSGGAPVIVTSASTVALPNQPVPTFTAPPSAALVTSMFFLPDGTLRAVARVAGESDNRLIDIPLSDAALSVARTDPGVPDGAYGAFTEFGGLVYAINFSSPTTPLITTPDSNGGALPPPDDTGGGTGGTTGGNLGSPTLGTIDLDTGEFFPVNTGNAVAPGRLPTAITDVQAIAYNRAARRLFIVDQTSTLLEISASTGAIVRTIGVVRDAISNQALRVSSMAFDNTGRLIAHDSLNARAVDISTANAVAGGVVNTAPGTLAATVSALAFDPQGSRFLAVDNATGINLTANTLGSSNLPTSQLLQIPLSLAASPTDIGQIFIGGTIGGQVSLGGSVDEFYAGWIITGAVSGLQQFQSANPNPGNFRVNGDLRSLITAAPIGTAGVAEDITATTYRTGTDISVSGRVGSVRVLGDTLASFRAFNERPTSSLPNAVRETESKALTAGQNDGVGFKFEGATPGGPGGTGNPGRAGGPAVQIAGFFNDTFASAQRLSPVSNADGSSSGTATVNGTLENIDGVNDSIDFYSVPLFAGQSLDIRLTSTGQYFGIFDPDGRFVFSSHSFQAAANPSSAFRYTADRPGEYRIAVAQAADTNFNGSVADAFETGVQQPGSLAYTLTLSNLGDLAIGAVVATGTIVDNAPFFTDTNIFDFSTIYAARGDIGAILATRVLGVESSSANTVRAAGGGIRSIDVGQAGEFRNGVFQRGISYAANGNVGIVRSQTGVLVINDVLTPPTTNRGTLANFNPDLYRIRGNVQVISAAGTLVGTMIADGAIGTIRAGDMAVTVAPFINVNADNVGNDGVIDLIDVIGNIGTGVGGGPVIYTNQGGNIRYMRAGGIVFRDRAFGDGTVSQIFQTSGTPLSFVDDSGASLSVRFDERAFVPNPDFDPRTPGSPRFLNAPTIAYQSYPVRSGGSVMMTLQINNLGTTNTLQGSAPMMTISTSANSGRGAEIGTLLIGGTDRAVVVDADGNFSQGSTNAATGTATPSYRVSIEGSRLDIFSLSVLDAAVAAAGNVTSIVNRTGGELLDFSAASIGTLSWSGDIGVARRTTSGAALLPFPTGGRSALQNLYPFVNQPYLITPGNVIRLESSGAIGNIAAANIGTAVANSGGVDIADQYEGVVAPVVSVGRINSIRFGEGILPAGSGAVGAGVVIAGDRLGEVTGSGDIRGIVASSDSIGTLSVTGNGAIINSLVTVFAQSAGNPFFGLAPVNSSSASNIVILNIDNAVNPGIQNPRFEVDRITVAGGIIGTSFFINDLGSLSAGGFGIIDSFIQGAGFGRFNSISASGYGLRSVRIDPGTSMGSVTARGDGSQLPTTSVTPSVRRSEFETIDSFFGFTVNTRTDIHVNLTTSAAVPIIPAITDTGVIEDVTIRGNGSLSSVSAYTIRGSVPIKDASNASFSDFTFGTSIGSITTRSLINGLVVRTGRLTTFAPGSDVLALDLTVAGPINSFRVKGDLASDSTVASIGPNARIGSFRVDGDFEGLLLSEGRVGTMTIGGSLIDGQIDINRNNDPGIALSRLNLSGSLLGSRLVLNGNVGTISIAGTTGTAGDTLTVNGNLTALNAGTNRKIADKTLAMNVSVSGSIGSITVNGRITGAVTAGGSIRNLRVTSDSATPNAALIDAPITSTDGDIGTVTVTNGDINSDLSAFGKITAINVSKGVIRSGSLVSTTAGDIGAVSVRGGSILGSIRAGESTALRTINSITTDANLGDGNSPLSILASRLNTLKVGGSVFSQVLVDIAGPINSLTINGDLREGATIRATAINRQTIKGNIDGDIILT